MSAPLHYKNLPMRCAPGVHEAAMALLLKHAAPRAGVLDLAAGSGAFLARLADHGFTDLHAIELDAGKFQLAGITPQPIDLDADFASKLGRRFHLVTAIEIIEHLESPRHFLREIHALLDDGGRMLISTPNVSDWAGRIKFLLTGNLRFFDENQYLHNRHISPITDVQMKLMLRETGFELIERVSAGSFRSTTTRAILSPIAALFALLGARRGDVNIYLAAKTTPRPMRPGDWTPI